MVRVAATYPGPYGSATPQDLDDTWNRLSAAITLAMASGERVELDPGWFPLDRAVLVPALAKGLTIVGADIGEPGFRRSRSRIVWCGGAATVDDPQSAALVIEAGHVRLERISFTVAPGGRLASAVRIQRRPTPTGADGPSVTAVAVRRCGFLGGRSLKGSATKAPGQSPADRGEMVVGVRVGRGIDIDHPNALAPEMNLEHMLLEDCDFFHQTGAGFALLTRTGQSKMNRVIRCSFKGEKTETQPTTSVGAVLNGGLGGFFSYRALEELWRLQQLDNEIAGATPLSTIKDSIARRFQGTTIGADNPAKVARNLLRALAALETTPTRSTDHLAPLAGPGSIAWGIFRDGLFTKLAKRDLTRLLRARDIPAVRGSGIVGGGSFSATACSFSGLSSAIVLWGYGDAISVVSADSEQCDAFLRAQATSGTPISITGSRLIPRYVPLAVRTISDRYINVRTIEAPVTIIGSAIGPSGEAPDGAPAYIRVGDDNSTLVEVGNRRDHVDLL